MILQFTEELMHRVPKKGAISFDFDGTLTEWDPDKKGYHEEAFEPAVHRLTYWHRMGRKVLIVTHRTAELEGNAAFLGHGKDKMAIADFIAKYNLPVSMTDVIFTHMGDKGEVLKKLGVVMHYDDECENLESAARAGVIAVKVDSGFKPPKTFVPGDGSGRGRASTPSIKSETSV